MGKKKHSRELSQEEIDELLSKRLPVPQAGAIYGLNRSASYDAARRGDIETFNMGRLKRAPTAPIRKKLRLAE